MAIKFPPPPKMVSTSVRVATPKSPPTPKLPKSPAAPHLPTPHARPHEFRPTPLKPPKGPVAAKAAEPLPPPKTKPQQWSDTPPSDWSAPSDAWEK